MARKGQGKSSEAKQTKAESYRHPEDDSPLRPEIGTQPKFKKKKPPVTYRYDSSLSPALEWDGQNGARDLADFLLSCIKDAARLPAPQVFDAPRELALNDGTTRATVRGLGDAVDQLAALGKPFLNWAGKAERLSFDVPTLPLFVHERLSTAAIIDTLKSHRKPADVQLDLFGDPQHPISDQLLRAYEYRDKWVNRMILGDSLVVMSSLLHYEGLAGQVQTIYMDPPYGVKFGSNFQPFVRKRDVKHNDDDDMTREPEMVKAYRDTWELGLHSYLTYMRDRLLLARELLTPSGSIFVQISDENLHHVRELMDEVFGADCFVVTIPFKKKGSQKSDLLDPINDYVMWYSHRPRALGGVRFHQLFEKRELDRDTISEFKYVQLPDGREFLVGETPSPDGKTQDYRNRVEDLFADWPGARLFRSNPLTSGGERVNQSLPYEYKGRVYSPGMGNCWKTTVRSESGIPGMKRLENAGRLFAGKNQLRFKSFYDDFGFSPISNWWDGLGGASDPVYVVQTNREIVQRCVLMTPSPATSYSTRPAALGPQPMSRSNGGGGGSPSIRAECLSPWPDSAC